MLPKRMRTLDLFRGFTILAMVLANFLAGAEVIPSWLKHAPDVGLTVIDLIAPFFIFAIGFTYRQAFERRSEQWGLRAAFTQLARRYLVLIGIGTIISAAEALFGLSTTSHRWGVLEAIGVAGLGSLLFIRVPRRFLPFCGLALLIIYQVVLDRSWISLVLSSSHGGLPGAISWTAMLILAISLSDLYQYLGEKRYLYALVGFWLIISGSLWSLITPISKNRVSSPYVLVSLGAAVVAYFLLDQLVVRTKLSLSALERWGQNPLALYLSHLVLLGIFALPTIPAWYNQAPLWLIILQAATLIWVLNRVSQWLEKKNLYMKL